MPDSGFDRWQRAISPSQSNGLPWAGRLHHGVRLHETEVLRRLPRFSRSDNFFGTAELVSMLERAAQTVAQRWPGSQLTVGELSARSGGWIEGHHSHRNGRDADVAFYMRDERGRMGRFWRFVSFAHNAFGSDRTLRFDDARNWAMVASMLQDSDARVQYMFVANPIRRRLLKAGRRAGASDDLLRAAAAVLIEPRQGNKHTDHFHIRIFCSRDDRPTCEDGMPYWPWYDGTPPDGTFAELPTIRWTVN